MSRVRYEQVTGLGKPWHEATIEVGALGFAGRGATYTEALADLRSNLKGHAHRVQRALNDLEAEKAPATPAWE